jgi:toxin ParE1/3/4
MPAANQLRSIFDYIATDNPAAASRTVRRIREVILRTATMPYAGRVGRVSGTREANVPGTPYLFAYGIIDKNMIHVLAIFHGVQDWPESFKSD